jgi:hypothetical protein
LKVLKAPIAAESRFLVYALVFTILCHAVAMGSMLLFLLPGIPGGNSDLAHRMSYMSSHAFQWRLGWFPWQMTALSDLFLAIALLRTTWIPKFPAWISVILTGIAILFEQPAEWRWTTAGIDLAKSGDLAQYLIFESEIFRLTSHWAAFFYTLAAICWSICLAKAEVWNAWMTRLSFVLWSLLIAVSLGPLLLPTLDPKIVSTGNAIGFNLMMLWFFGALYLAKQKTKTTNQNDSIHV